jgi:hypothetical protein
MDIMTIGNDPFSNVVIEDARQEIWIKQAAALGLVIKASATVENLLRDAFSSLVGSKYAAVVAGGQGTEWLIDNCRAVRKGHREIAPDSKGAIDTALLRCKTANARRNELVHGEKVEGNLDGSLGTLRSRRLTHVLTEQAWTLREINDVAQALWDGCEDLWQAMTAAVSPEMMEIGQELGRMDYEDCRRADEDGSPELAPSSRQAGQP